MKRIVGLILVVCLLGSITGCNNSQNVSSQLDEEVTIQFMHHYGEAYDAFFDSIIRDFEAENELINVEVVYVDGNYEGVVEKLQLLGASDMLPDIAISGLQYHDFMLNNFELANVSELMDIDSVDASQYYDTMLAFGKNDEGNIMALPFAISTPVLYVNNSIYESAGYSLEDMPSSMEEIATVAKAISETAGVDGVHYSYKTTGSWIVQAMVDTYGGALVADGKMNLDSDEVISVVDDLNTLVNEDQSMSMMTTQESAVGFMSGGIGMLIGSSAYGPLLKANAPIEFTTVMFPTYNNERVIPAGGNNLYILTEDPDKKRAAWEFMKYLTSEEVAVTLTKNFGYMTANKVAVETPELLGDYLANESDHAKVMYDQVEDMVPWVNFPGDSGTRIHDILANAIDSVLLGEMDAKTAMENANEEANDLID